MNPIIERITLMNSDRASQNIFRRLSKLYEEFGELNQAILNYTSRRNPKNKTCDDVVEEFVDVAVMAFDIAATFASAEEIIEMYDTIGPQMTAVLVDSNDKISLAFEALSLMAREIGYLASSIHVDTVERIFNCIVMASLAMYCAKQYMEFHDDEIREIFKEKLDKWERNVAQKLDLCPTATQEQVDAANEVLSNGVGSVSEHGWKPYVPGTK